MNRVSTQRVGGRRVAPDTVLGVVNRYAISPVRSTSSEGHQVGVVRRELLSHCFDPGADALEGMTGPERHKDVQTLSPAGLRVSCDSCLVEGLVQPQRRFPHGIERGCLTGIQIKIARSGWVRSGRWEPHRWNSMAPWLANHSRPAAVSSSGSGTGWLTVLGW